MPVKVPPITVQPTIWSPALLGLAVLLIDQLTKWLLIRFAPDFVIGNRGVALGQLSYLPTRSLILLVGIVLCAVLYWYSLRFQLTATSLRLGFALFAAGGLSNLIDRLLHGAIVDYLPPIALVKGGLPIINLGDIAIVTGLVLLGYFAVKR